MASVAAWLPGCTSHLKESKGGHREVKSLLFLLPGIPGPCSRKITPRLPFWPIPAHNLVGLWVCMWSKPGQSKYLPCSSTRPQGLVGDLGTATQSEPPSKHSDWFRGCGWFQLSHLESGWGLLLDNWGYMKVEGIKHLDGFGHQMNLWRTYKNTWFSVLLGFRSQIKRL